MSYHHLVYENRVEIYALHKAGHNQTAIATLIGVSRSTISREMRRNTGLKGYRPQQAHQRALARKRQAAKHIRFTKAIQAIVTTYLKQDWSPEQISGWLKKNNVPSVSPETIYQFVIADQKAGGDLYKHLRHGHKKRRKRLKSRDRRGQIPRRVSIDQRPPLVDEKTRVGDWELDTIVGKNHKGAIVTAVERKTKFTCMRLVPTREANVVADAIIDMLKPFIRLIFTLTSDNGKEFSEHEKIAKQLHAQFFFAHPYCSWERGLNENTNGLIRQYFPKKTEFLQLKNEKITEVQDKLNNRPRKTLYFEKPNVLFTNSLVALGT